MTSTSSRHWRDEQCCRRSRIASSRSRHWRHSLGLRMDAVPQVARVIGEVGLQAVQTLTLKDLFARVIEGLSAARRCRRSR